MYRFIGVQKLGKSIVKAQKSCAQTVFKIILTHTPSVRIFSKTQFVHLSVPNQLGRLSTAVNRVIRKFSLYSTGSITTIYLYKREEVLGI